MNLLTPVTLKGKHATLVPLSIEHCAALIEVVKDGELWRIFSNIALSKVKMAWSENKSAVQTGEI